MLIMNETARRVAWRVSILGVGASVVLGCLSFHTNWADRLFPWTIPLFLVFFVLLIVMLLHHRTLTGS